MSILLAGLAVARLVGQAAPPTTQIGPSSRIRIVPQHSGGLIQDIEESRDGSRLLTHDKGYAPRLWDAKRQILLRVLDAHPDLVSLVNFSADGSRVLTRSPREVRVWDSARAKCLFTFAIATGDATSAVISGDGSTVAVGTAKGAVILYRQGQPKTLGLHLKGVRALAFNSNGTLLASGSDDGIGRLWNLKSGGAPKMLVGHKGPIRWFDFSPSSDLLLSTSEDETAGLWNFGGKLLATYPQVIGIRGVGNVQMGAVFVGKSGNEIAACSKSGTIYLYKPGATKPARALVGHTRDIRELRRSHDGRFIATYANDSTLRMWDVTAGKQIPFDPKGDEPTAGEFSPNRDVFWLGYSMGEVRQFDLKTGKATHETFGDVEPVASANLVGNSSILYWRGEPGPGITWAAGTSQHIFIDVAGSSTSQKFRFLADYQSLSPDGNYIAINSRTSDDEFQFADVRAGKIRATAPTMLDVGWSSDSTRLATLSGSDGVITVIDTKTGTVLKRWKWPTDKKWGSLNGPVWHPNGKWMATFHHPGHEIIIWDSETGKAIYSFGKFEDLYSDATFFDEGRTLLVQGWSSIRSFDVESGKLRWEKGAKDYDGMHGFQSSIEAGQIAFTTDKDTVILDATTGKEVFRAKGYEAFGWSPATHQLLIASEKEAIQWDTASKKILRRLPHAGRVVSCGFAAGGRMVTADSVEGFHVWSPQGKRRATVVAMKDGSWLAYDDDGRYDATDPSNVTGAYFILEWEKGLEPISMGQLKGQFYEPHLLAKALGMDTEAVREVPDLESMRLFPDLTVKSDGGLKYDIGAKERDNGGIGTIRVSINGKEVVRKKGTGFFTLDLKPYESFLMPQSRLNGESKNLLSVTVSNESGELVSPPEVVDVGVPDDLKTPDVKLYALCAGIGDYAGTAGDLAAPPSDATAIAEALNEVTSRLLPGKTEVTLMTTQSDAKRPNRTNILAWLKEVAAKSTSSDIVLVFVAGHGTNKIGDQTGYFLLTSEADPGDLTPASAKTSAISGEELRQALAAIPAGKQVVILDTCHSGAASDALLASGRSVSGEYQRAWEAIKDTTGTWLLAGAAADQVSYESANVDHGMLTYALLEAVDTASSDGLRKTPSGELFVDVERWLSYAANRVESLKNEVGIKGIQRPEFKRATRGETFDIGVMDAKRKGFLELRPPLPIVIVGNFQKDQEDPLNLEESVAVSMKDAKAVKPWFDIAKHPNVYRMTGEYTVDGDAVHVRLILQAFDDRQQRKNLESVEILGTKSNLGDLATRIRQEVESRIKALEAAKAAPTPDGGPT